MPPSSSPHLHPQPHRHSSDPHNPLNSHNPPSPSPAFILHSPYPPAGDQKDAISKLIAGHQKYSRQTLLGITGSGKTFVVANVIAALKKPTLILAHNKTLAAQLYQELKYLFPHNRVEYFISYYDYYQPESYLPTTDTYIEKEATINRQIEKMRLSATAALLSRSDVIVVSSISCIYGLGNPDDFYQISLDIHIGQKIARRQLISHLVSMQYERSDTLESGRFRIRGDTIDVYPAYDTRIIRIELFGDEIDTICDLDNITTEKISNIEHIRIFAAKQFVVPEQKHAAAIASIKEELSQWLPDLAELEAQRLSHRVRYDLEMIEEVGYCNGIENYSRHFDERKVGDPPYTLLNYFPDDFLLIIDESHQSIPQAHGMYAGDYSRKKNLVDFGFRLPCAYDNRPLKFAEFEKFFRHAIFVSATPGHYECETSGQIVELIIRPTGLLDPKVTIRPIDGQISDLLREIRTVTARHERVLVTTLTKRMAEDLTEYLSQENISVRYLHSDIESLDRIELIRQLRSGEFDVLVGINLLREGLDLPEVSLVAILDADKEGFLRDERSLIQTIGRAARNINGHVIMYADIITRSIRSAIDITHTRRQKQQLYNTRHGIVPQTITKAISPKKHDLKDTKHLSRRDIHKLIIDLEAEMKKAAEALDFERAIALRDRIKELNDSLPSKSISNIT